MGSLQLTKTKKSKTTTACVFIFDRKGREESELLVTSINSDVLITIIKWFRAFPLLVFNNFKKHPKNSTASESTNWPIGLLTEI